MCVRFFSLVAFAIFFTLPSFAQDQGSFGKVIRIDRNGFSPDAGLITFSEFGLKSRNPFYRSETYGGGRNGIGVTFGGYFSGQTLGNSGQCPVGANRNGCVVGTPRNPLSLDANSPTTFIANDGSNPTSPVLSGSPQFNGAISIMFDQDIAGVGLTGGYFNSVKSTAITVFDRSGRKIGGVKNLRIGMEYMALVTEDGSNQIAGLLFSLVGAERAGYAIDELSFALAGQINRAQVPKLGDILSDVDTPKKTPGGNVKKVGSLTSIFEKKEPAGGVNNDTPKKADPGISKKPAGGLTDLFKSK